MPSRVMQAKINKLKASKRKAYLTKPRSGGVDTGKITAHQIFQNRNRVNTTSGKAGASLPILQNTWITDPPKTKALITFDPDTGEVKLSPRAVVLKEVEHLHNEAVEKKERMFLFNVLRKTWQGTWRQGVSVYNTLTMKEQENFSIKLYFSGNEAIFVQETKDKRWISATYNGTTEAMEAYKSKISWIIQESK